MIVVAVAVTARGAVYLAAVIRGPGAIAAGHGPGALQMSHNGRFLYVADYGDQNSAGSTVTIINLADGNAAKSIRVGDFPTGLAVTPNGRVLYVMLDLSSITGSAGGKIVRVDPLTGAVSQPLQFPGGAQEMALSPDDRTLYVVSGTRRACLFPASEGQI